MSNEVVYSDKQLNKSDQLSIETNGLASGMYIVKIAALKSQQAWPEKICINRN